MAGKLVAGGTGKKARRELEEISTVSSGDFVGGGTKNLASNASLFDDPVEVLCKMAAVFCVLFCFFIVVSICCVLFCFSFVDSL